MSEEQNNNTPNLETESTTEDTATVSQEEEVQNIGNPSIDNYKDDYDRQVDNLLARHKAKQEQTEMPEQEGLREGESWDRLFEQADEKSRRAMQQLRADYTRKTQELAAERKSLVEKAEKLQSIKMNLEDNAAYRAIQEAAQQETGEFDPYDTESFEKYVNKIVAERLQSVLQPMAEQQMKANAKAKVESFMSQHPDLQTDENLKSEVRKTLIENESLSLQDAYWIVKGRRSHSIEARKDLEAQAFKNAAKASGLKIGVGQKKGKTIPKESSKMKAADLYQHLLKQQK
tara:strand:+ start:5644 stop:6507 length:864 start_codon:yes stop_codon:yes gene_type:complete